MDQIKRKMLSIIIAGLVIIIIVFITFDDSPYERPWEWTAAFNTADIDLVSLTINSSEIQLSDDNLKHLVGILNSLKREDFSRKTDPIDPSDFLITDHLSIKQDDIYLMFKKIDDANFRLIFDNESMVVSSESKWFVNSTELAMFFKDISSVPKEGETNTTDSSDE